MADGRNNRGRLIETLLFYLRYRYLTTTECLLFLYLYELADSAGCGYVDHMVLSERFGRSRGRCRAYLNRLRRHGLIAVSESDGRGAYFKLEMPSLVPDRRHRRQRVRFDDGHPGKSLWIED